MDNFLDKRGVMVGLGLGLVTGTFGSILVPLIRALIKAIGVANADLIYLGTVGMCFGAGLGYVLRARLGFSLWKIATLTILTPVFYYVAMSTAVSAADLGRLISPMVIPGLAGGAVGAFLVVILVGILTRFDRRWSLIVPVTLAGSLAGAVFLPLSQYGPDVVGMSVLHAPWHASVLAVLLGGLYARFPASNGLA